MTEAWCPKCNKEVEINEPWDNFTCSLCGLRGYWDEICSEDYSDCWVIYCWDY